jgi:hypothetical protein
MTLLTVLVVAGLVIAVLVVAMTVIAVLVVAVVVVAVLVVAVPVVVSIAAASTNWVPGGSGDSLAPKQSTGAHRLAVIKSAVL